MIIIDYNQIAIANIIGGIECDLNENYIRHMILNSIRGYIKKFKKAYGSKVVLACDGTNYWRRDIFPPYKASRAKARKDSKYDWKYIHEVMSLILEELKEWSPFYIIHLDNCEGDDIIYTIASTYQEPHIILSSDKDFVFLHSKTCKQFSPIKKKFITHKDPQKVGLELIIRGDRVDGIPNILSPDDTFITGKRQRSIMQAKLDIWLTQKPEEFCDETTITNFRRNDNLINLEKIPPEIQSSILQEFSNLRPSNASRFSKYLIAKDAKILFQFVGEFF